MPPSSSLFTQIKTTLEVLSEDPQEAVHPADRLFADLILKRPLGQTAQLHLADRLLRMYRSYLAQRGVSLPLGSEIEETMQEALYTGLADLLQSDSAEEMPEQRVYLAHERVMVEFPYEIAKQMALAPLKETVYDWAFNRFHRKEWSYPLEAIESIVEALAPFNFTFSAQANLLYERVQRKTVYLQEVARFEFYWQELEHLEAQKCIQEALDDPVLPDGRTLYAHQREAIERLVHSGRLVLAHDMGLGKAQPLNAKVLTPSGWKYMGDVKRGDEIINSEGGTSHILEVFPQGEKDIYRVTFGDGSCTECCDDHLWSVNTPVRKRRGNPYQILSLKELRQSLTHTLQPRKNKGQNLLYKYYIPMVRPVQFPEKNLRVDPYVMGVLIGDGGFGGISVMLTSADDEIIQEVQRRIPEEVKVKHAGKYSWNLSTGNTGNKVKNPITLALREVGLAGHLSYTKFIPDCYKYASVLQRIEFLQGLLDTDGSVREKDNTIEFGTASQQLALDVVELVQSLGGKATIHQKIPSFVYNGVKKVGVIFYRMSICLPPDIVPFKLSRKANLYHPRKKYHPCRAIVKVEHVGKKEAQCIVVDAPDHLYVTDDYILTHNTVSSLLAAQAYRRPIFVIAPVSTHIPWLREAATIGVSIEIYSWAKLPAIPEQAEFVLIGDEAHAIQNVTTQRSKAFLALAERASAVYCVTGTPMKNAQAMNLFPLLKACKHPLGDDQRAYESRYCAGYMRRIGKRNVYEATGAVNLDELHEKTRDVILYKRKSECLDLPPKIRVMRAADITLAGEQLYEETIARLWKEHEDRMQARQDAAQAMLEAAREEGTDIDPKLLEVAKGDSTFARALVEMNILRHAASLAKVDAAVAVAEEVQEQGGSIVIFSVYRDTAHQLALFLHADCLSGDTAAKERQVMIDRFQDRQSSVLICTAAGGLGITLTAAQCVVLVERPWTPGEVVQYEDRLHRIGQLGTVTSVWLQYGLMDDRVDRLLEQKQRVIDHVLVGQAAVEASGMNRSVLSSAREILQSIREGIPLETLLSQREKELIAQAEAAAKAKQATPSQLPEEKKPQTKRARPGRPRKGGDTAALRERFEITLDGETLQRLKERTTNRSAYIERLILEEKDNDDPGQFEQIQAKLFQRCQHFPPAVAASLQQIQAKRGIQAALEASEAVALILDPARASIP